ncbi:hypothetical protein K2173_004087 [Erythroxylum novogranatense]|uniref:non-specific serine/threonine protein kinase n=1 Tax=Erythroxylum novogranatense TaxID=1862640 RepID=A0AAV8SJI7_9ROSI|nr:hypothetical protein K2173_004087 [Erythroxylum novogranatense]
MAAVFWVLFVCLVSSIFSQPFTTTTDTSALLRFKSSVFSDPLNLLSSWSSASDCCTWYGVTCDEFSGRVIALNITGSIASLLAGTVPDSIGNLTELRSLILSHNALSGEIPASIGNLRFLEVLEFQGNNFSGIIPARLSTLQSLQVLNFSFNSLSGEIPGDLIGSGNLRVIDLSNNKLIGDIRINGSRECLGLKHLKLSNNLLENNIPKQIGNCKNLRTLLLDGNNLGGQIPVEIGQLPELRVLDVSTNSLNDKIPKELANCRKLAVAILTNLSNFVGFGDKPVIEFNAFDESIPYELLTLPSLQILWAPRANLHGELPRNWSNSCSLRVLHLGQNSLTGIVPEGLGVCKNLTFLDLSYNRLVGYLPERLQVPCMIYFNVSQNSISGSLPSFPNGNCDVNLVSCSGDPKFLDLEDMQTAYSNIPVWGIQMENLLGSINDEGFPIVHDFSWNQFNGNLPLFSFGEELLKTKTKCSYKLYLNSNAFNGSLPGGLVTSCNNLLSISVNVSANHLSGELKELLLFSCRQMREFEAAYNQISGSLTHDLGNLKMLEYIDLRGNKLSGYLPSQLESLQSLQVFLLGGNNLTGEIPSQFGQLTSLMVLDLSHNNVTGKIPISLVNAKSLEILLLNNNKLSGEIPWHFSDLPNLTLLDVSFNNLSGPVPHVPSLADCDRLKGNTYMDLCPEKASSSELPLSGTGANLRNPKKKKIYIIAAIISATLLVFLLPVVVLILVCWKRRFCKDSNLKEKIVVTFADAHAELTYDNVVRATGNFSLRYLIGTGGFGSTYKAELSPGCVVAVKRLSIGRIQGTQQFDAEIRTLGRIRHKNLVTLIGYYVGEAEMFLVYNYLSGGNLETFIHDNSGKNVQWSVIYKIALDIAQALAYLHYSCVPRVLHRDIKPSNILLDQDLNAYLSDFGLARLLAVSQTHLTTDVAGTFGYVAPEYATTCRVSDKSDVYSFGIVLLELLSGKRSLDPSFSEYGNGFNIVAWAKMMIKEGRSSEFFSSELWEPGPKEKLLGLLKLASTCTVESLSVRPSMKQILEKLKQLKT